MSDKIHEIMSPGVNITPQITLNESKNLLEKLYGLKCKTIVELNAYDDKNYKILVEEYCDNKNISKINKSGYVFKILNSFDSKKVSFIEGQNDMMLYLGENNIKCPKLVLNKSGKYFSIENMENTNHVVRLLEYIPGILFCEAPESNKLFFDAGKYVANLDLVLKNFYHPVYENHRSLWMLESISEIRKFLYVIQNKEDLKMIADIIFQFESKVLCNIDILEKGYLHGDFNEQNIIVQNTQNGWKIDAILDFGDTQFSCLIFELAVATMYMIIQGKDVAKAGYFLAGYSTIRPIPEHELKLLKVCVAARFCQSLVMGTYSNLQNPDNKYVLSTQATGWMLLKQLWERPNEELIEEWKKVILNQ